MRYKRLWIDVTENELDTKEESYKMIVLLSYKEWELPYNSIWGSDGGEN